MIDCIPFCTPHECSVLPAISVGEILCDDCQAAHGFFVHFQFLFWGLDIMWFFDTEEAI